MHNRTHIHIENNTMLHSSYQQFSVELNNVIENDFNMYTIPEFISSFDIYVKILCIISIYLNIYSRSACSMFNLNNH